jgi:hypothetical protein
MIELYLHSQALKMERELLDKRHAQRAGWVGRMSISKGGKPAGVRRRLALALLALANWLDPRPVISTAHTPRPSALNGRLHHA